MLRVVAFLVALAALSGAGATVALATSGTGQQNADLLVSVSLSPDVAGTGDAVLVFASVRNTSERRQSVTVTATLTLPDGTTAPIYSQSVMLRPGQMVSESVTYVVEADDPRGLYTLTVSATGPRGTSSASARVTYV